MDKLRGFGEVPLPESAKRLTDEPLSSNELVCREGHPITPDGALRMRKLEKEIERLTRERDAAIEVMKECISKGERLRAALGQLGNLSEWRYQPSAEQLSRHAREALRPADEIPYSQIGYAAFMNASETGHSHAGSGSPAGLDHAPEPDDMPPAEVDRVRLK